MKVCGYLSLHLPTSVRQKTGKKHRIQPVTALATSNLSCRISIADGSDYKANAFVERNSRLWSKLYWYKCLFTINSQTMMGLIGRNIKDKTAGFNSIVLPRRLNYDIKLPNLGLCLPLSSLYGYHAWLGSSLRGYRDDVGQSFASELSHLHKCFWWPGETLDQRSFALPFWENFTCVVP